MGFFFFFFFFIYGLIFFNNLAIMSKSFFFFFFFFFFCWSELANGLFCFCFSGSCYRFVVSSEYNKPIKIFETTLVLR